MNGNWLNCFWPFDKKKRSIFTQLDHKRREEMGIIMSDYDNHGTHEEEGISERMDEEEEEKWTHLKRSSSEGIKFLGLDGAKKGGGGGEL